MRSATFYQNEATSAPYILSSPFAISHHCFDADKHLLLLLAPVLFHLFHALVVHLLWVLAYSLNCFLKHFDLGLRCPFQFLLIGLQLCLIQVCEAVYNSLSVDLEMLDLLHNTSLLGPLVFVDLLY